jgi:hypothetical protein
LPKQKGWSKQARSKGYGVERSAVKYYKNLGIFAIRLPNSQQVGELAKIDYIVVLKGVFGQGKYMKKYMTKEIKNLILDGCKQYPKSDLTAELAYRDGPHKHIKFEVLE